MSTIPPVSNTVSTVDPTVFRNGMTYASYRHLIKELLAEGKTTGPNQSEALFDYTKLNDHRMDRVEKTFVLRDELRDRLRHLEQPVDWLVFTEAWCGDAAASIPMLDGLAEASPVIRMRLILRDENADLFSGFLSNGASSIPKLVALEPETGRVLYTWGPRPAPAQDMVMAYKADTQDVPYSTFVQQVQLWYAKDRGKTLQDEFTALLVS